MTISISSQAYWELWQEANPSPQRVDPSDHLDVIWKNRLYYHRCSTITLAMQLALRQLLRCPYQGITKRMYLQSKILELLAMIVEQELELQQGKLQPTPLKFDEVDRIHQARSILLQRLDRPPSLLELARLVGLNDYTLKRRFKQVFGKTVFGYLHDYRLEQAQQLLASGEMKVEESRRW